MAHRYSAPIAVELAPDGQPEALTWRGRRYAVQVIGTWKLATGWWDPAQHTDRTYWRVETAGHEVFELYHDAVSGAWILDVVQD